MSSMAASSQADRANRWMLIGALALALLAGVLVFAGLANFGRDNTNGLGSASADVLIAKETIKAGNAIKADDFRVARVAERELVIEAVADLGGVEGQIARTDILQGQQLSLQQIAQSAGDALADQLTFKIPEGQRAVAVEVGEVTGVGGLLIPGDRVDVLVTVKERILNTDQSLLRVRTVLQNVEVLARAQDEVNNVPALGTNGRPNADGQDPNVARRPDNLDADPELQSVTLSLTPEQVQQLVLADALGDITLSMRPFGESQQENIDDVSAPILGE